ncbi:MAG: NAD(P)H-binding protein [Bacteroidetes bacterium]|nr:NAD(P)H-binding protein [Bacteroidota bacterium]
MKYVITGSLGNISKPLTEKLIEAGHDVTVITSKESNRAGVEALGAKAAIGSVEDAAFILSAFEGADAVYLMIPPKWEVADWLGYQQQVADNYVAAVQKHGIKHVVELSSIGAHMRKGAGPIDGLGYLEEKLGTVSETAVKFLRPSFFYTNFFAMIPLIKGMNIMGSNYGNSDEKMVLVHPADIADAAFEELNSLSFSGHTVRYIASDERHPSEVAAVLGKAVGKPELPWVPFSDEQSLEGLKGAGLSAVIAEGYTSMGASIRNGKVQEDYWKQRPAVYGKIKLEDFAKEFAAVYNHQ